MVTGGGRGVGRAVVERLAAGPDTVVVIEFDGDALAWAAGHPRVVPVIGDAADPEVTDRAAARATEAAPLRGWVNNAAVFRDAWLHEAGASEVATLVGANLNPVLTGCATALRTFLAAGTAGAIVNVSSHQAQRPVRGSLPYATAKAATEGLTRALAVDYGPHGIRVNAVALGSIATERSDAHLASLDEPAAAHFEREIRLLQPLARMGRTAEVAEVVAFLLSDAAAFLSGVVLPVDGGRSAVGRDPEERNPAIDDRA